MVNWYGFGLNSYIYINFGKKFGLYLFMEHLLNFLEKEKWATIPIRFKIFKDII